MSNAENTLAATGSVTARWQWKWPTPWTWVVGPRNADATWALAFLTPYVFVLVAFMAYPIAYAFWLGRSPESYFLLFDNPRYLITLFNTLLMVAVAVNIGLFLAFLLSGFFLLRGWWIKAMLVVFMLPWALPALPANLSLHWMLEGYGGLINIALHTLFGIDGPTWFDSYGTAMGANILAFMWKWMPFWTLVFMAGRMAIPQDVYEAGAVDGATKLQCFTHITFPMLANLYLIATLLFTLWTMGDFITTYFVSSGAPALQTEVISTYAFRITFDYGRVDMGIAAVLSLLPITVPLALWMMRRLQVSEMQL
jgi:multiple sugar transport system permease protein